MVKPLPANMDWEKHEELHFLLSCPGNADPKSFRFEAHEAHYFSHDSLARCLAAALLGPHPAASVSLVFDDGVAAILQQGCLQDARSEQDISESVARFVEVECLDFVNICG